MPDQADTYKCFATNEFGQATVTVVLNVIEGELLILMTPYLFYLDHIMHPLKKM